MAQVKKAEINENVGSKTLPQTLTNYEALRQAKVFPKSVLSKGYKPFHMRDNGTHTKLIPKANTIIDHTMSENGSNGKSGGFVMNLKKGPAPWKGWRDLAEGGMEIVDFRCGICQKEVPLEPTQIQKHMQIHMGANKRNLQGGEFWLTFAKPSAIPEEGADSDNVEFEGDDFEA